MGTNLLSFSLSSGNSGHKMVWYLSCIGSAFPFSELLDPTLKWVSFPVKILLHMYNAFS